LHQPDDAGAEPVTTRLFRDRRFAAAAAVAAAAADAEPFRQRLAPDPYRAVEMDHYDSISDSI